MKPAANITPLPDSKTMAEDSQLDAFLGYHLKRASHAVQVDLAQTLAPFDLRMITFSALAVIVKNAGLRQSQLADALEIERPNLVVVIDELETQGLIVRKQVPHDRRAYALHPTKDGKAHFADVVEAVKAHEARLFAEFSQEERATLRSALLKIEAQRGMK